MNHFRFAGPSGLAVTAAIVLAAGGAGTAAGTGDAAGAEPAGAGPKSLLEAALEGPLADVREVVFATRRAYDDPHWYANIGYYCDDERRKAYHGNGKPDASALWRLELRSGRASKLLDAGGGTVRDPQVDYDAEKVLFSWRKAGSDPFHLYEVRLDGAGLRQITSDEYDDYEPTYLPDGDIAFVSTRCRRWVNCWMTQVGILYRSDPDGGNVRPISANTEHDNTPWPMLDGRLLYTRWEYVDRSQVEFHHLWVMNPDGTGQTVFYGNQHPHIVMIDAKPIPGSNKIVASFSPGHGANEHGGHATIVSPETGPDDRGAARRLHGGRLTRDPYPLSEDCFLLAREDEVLLMDGAGKAQVLHTHRDPDGAKAGAHEPRPVQRRPRERVIPERRREGKATGTMVLTDAYNGRNLPGVRRGEIVKLLVLESLPKPVNFSGGPDLTSWLGTFTLERVLGTVPVEEDGSACFEVPAGRQVFFVALDENDLSVKRMQSFTCVMPGETLSCGGCHEHRTLAPEARHRGTLQALRRRPSRIEPFEGFPDVLDFHRDVQPILDARCVKCHGFERRDGRVLLEGDLGAEWSLSYYSLFAHRQVADGRNGLGNQPPRTIGSSASPLLKKVDGSHHDVRVSPREWRTLWLWIESGAPYAGTYAALRNEAAQRREHGAAARILGAAGDVLVRRCRGCHAPGSERAIPCSAERRWQQDRSKIGRPTAVHERIVLEDDPLARFGAPILLNLSRPHLSPIVLGPLAREAGGFGSCGEVFRDRNDPDCRRLVAAIQAAKEQVDVEPRYATPGFRPNAQYVRELKRYGALPASFDPAHDPLDVFRTDQDYWRLLATPPEVSF
ncbi:MAG: hypothetical protein HY721_07475 [Planctomycetes bacterium]|nr:hypothetical protein [Planctomycetota bacterium]